MVTPRNAPLPLSLVIALAVAAPLASAQTRVPASAQARVLAAAAQPRVAVDSAGTRVTVRITRPDVGKPVALYPQVVLRPGDRWSLDAGGCVQTGGSGATWKRYVSPSGPNSDRLYHGTVAVVDGAPLVRLDSIIGREQIIPAALDPARLHLRLGYEDDDYRDNGYQAHDNGTGNQCLNQPDAYVVMTITRAPRAFTRTATALVLPAGARVRPTAAAPTPKLTTTVSGSAATPTEPLVAREGASALKLPVTYAPVPANAAKSGAAEPAVYEPRLEIDRFGLTFVPAKRMFMGTMRMQVIDTLHPLQPPKRLPAPIFFQLSVDGGTVVPDAPVVSEANWITPVQISTARRDSLVRMHVVPLGATKAIDVDIAVTRTPLELVAADTMPGFGLGRSEATVGLPMGADVDSAEVTLTANHGSVTPEHLWVRSGRPGHAVFRSDGLHQGILRAVAPGTGYGTANLAIAYVWPIGFLLAAVAGVLAGGLAKMAYKGLSWDGRTIFSVFVGGLVTGVLCAIVGSLLGVKIFDVFDPGGGWGLIGVFVLSLLGAWGGSAILDRFLPSGAAAPAGGMAPAGAHK